MDLLPPGVGFVPSDELLVSYYLANKNNEEVQNFHGSDLIKELNLFQYDPFELHLARSFFFPHTREFYCFTAKSDELRRHCKTGFWMHMGAVEDITVGADDVLVGKKSLFFFYTGNSPQNAIKTSWTMYEYTLVNNPQAPFVVCRVFDRHRGMDLDSELWALSDVDEGDVVGDDSDEKANEGTQQLKGVGTSYSADASAEQGDALHFMATQAIFQASYDAFLDCVVSHVEAITPEQFKLAIMDEDFI